MQKLNATRTRSKDRNTKSYIHNAFNDVVLNDFLSTDLARKQIMLLYNGNFHKILLTLTDSPHKEVQYNCAGIIGHLATNGKNIFCDSNQTTHLYQHQHTLSLSLSLSLSPSPSPSLSPQNNIIFYYWKKNHLQWTSYIVSYNMKI